jgi:nitric oxide reductase NorQ protein
MRGSYPIGTVFGSESIELRTHSSTPFYSAGAIYPMGLNLGAYIVGSHIPPKEMTDAWNDYKSKGIVSEPSQQTLFTQAGTATQPGTLLSQIKADRKLCVPTIDKDGFFIDNKDWYLLVRNIRCKVNTMLVGPSGAGKTELVMLACRKMGIECNVYDMGSMHDPLTQMLGAHRLESGKSVFDYAKFTQDIQKPGVILLDELSRAPLGTTNILFPCLDSRRQLPVEMAGGNDVRSISVHPDCIFIATANVGSEYTGTMSMDRALIGRFFSIELEYMPCTEEAKVLTKRYGINANDAANIVAVAETVRSLFGKQELSCSISTRETLAAASLVADGWTALDAMELSFLPLFEGTRTDGERSIVAKIFLTR